MIVMKKHLDRRTFLRGTGVTLALPLLDSMVPAFTALAASPAKPAKRFCAVYVPNGMNMDAWTPKAEGAAFELTSVLQPLAPFRPQLTVVSGLSHNTAKPLPGEGAGDHARGCATFLTGVHPKKTQGFDLQSGVSMDQILAKELGQETQFASLELGLDSISLAGSCDFDYSCTYVNTVAWRTPTTPLPVEISPRVVFERLFGDGQSTDPAARLARIRRNRSILDSVAENAATLERGLGQRDRAKLTEYLDAVREIERSIEKAEAHGATELPHIDRPTDIPALFEDHAKLMFDLLALAYQADLTRVATFMIGREVSNRSYPEIGVPDSHHPLSHHQRDPARLERLAKVNALHAMQFAHFLEKLRATPDGDGTLLDHSMILYGAGLSDSNDHTHDDLPLLVAGGGGGTLAGGRHLRYPKETPMTNLLLSLMGKMGVDQERFGDSSGRLPQLAEV